MSTKSQYTIYKCSVGSKPAYNVNWDLKRGSKRANSRSFGAIGLLSRSVHLFFPICLFPISSTFPFIYISESGPIEKVTVNGSDATTCPVGLHVWMLKDPLPCRPTNGRWAFLDITVSSNIPITQQIQNLLLVRRINLVYLEPKKKTENYKNNNFLHLGRLRNSYGRADCFVLDAEEIHCKSHLLSSNERSKSCSLINYAP